MPVFFRVSPLGTSKESMYDRCPLCGKAAQPQAVFCGGCEAFVGTPGVEVKEPSS